MTKEKFNFDDIFEGELVYTRLKPPQHTIYDNVLDVRTEDKKQLNNDDKQKFIDIFDDIME